MQAKHAEPKFSNTKSVAAYITLTHVKFENICVSFAHNTDDKKEYIMPSSVLMFKPALGE